jgi:antitoxin component YwqK of YwqJK toxin-antitoxin module
MKKALLFCGVLALVVLVSCNQSNTKGDKDKADTIGHGKLVVALSNDDSRINYADANGKKQGHWIIKNSERHLPGYSDTARVEEGDYKDNMKEGEWTEYNADGSVKSKTTFKDDQPVQ